MNDWKECTLSDIIIFKNGKKKPDTEGTFPVYGGNGILGYVNDYNLSKGIAIGRVGVYCGSVYYSRKECWISDNAIQAINRDNSDLIYDYYLLKSLRLNERRIGTSQPLLTQEILNRIVINCPDIMQQRKIAAVLSAIDNKIELNTAINENLEQQAQALFKNLIADIQERVPFTSVIQVLGGGTPKTGKQEYWNGEIPFFTPKDVGAPYVLTTEKSITPLGLDNCNSRLYPVNTVFLTARGTVGKVSLAGVPMSMNQSCYALAGKDGLHQIIVYHYVLETVKALKHKASGAVFDAIITRDFDTESVPALSSEQIDSFIAVAEPIYSDILNRTIENQRLAALRDTLLPKLMSGEIDVSAVKI